MNKAILVCGVMLFAGTTFASAQVRIEERKIEERPVIVAPVPGIAVERRDKEVIERRDAAGCETKTVRKETADSSTTVKKERCD